VTRYSFCPVCGAALSPDPPAGGIRTLHTCARCHFEFWQNSKPTVGALVVREVAGGPQVLLTRRAIEPYKDFWDVPGGFLHNGERPNDGLIRELQEELHVTVSVGDLIAAEIDEYPREDVAEEARFVLSLYYRCDLDAGAPLVPSDDVVEARWFPLSALPQRLAFTANRRALARLALIVHG